MRLIVAVSLVSLVSWPGLRPCGAEEPKAPFPSDELSALISSHAKAQEELNHALESAKTEEERQRAVKELGEKASTEACAGKIFELMRQHPEDQVVRLGLDWLLWNAPDAPATKDAADLVVRCQIKDENLAVAFCNLGGTLGYRDCAAAEGLLRAAVEKSPHRRVQGYARFCLARVLKRRCDLPADDSPKAREALEREAEKLYQEAADDYSDLPFMNSTLGKAAEADLYELRNLSVGKAAPEVEGRDLADKPLKLSDYRGKATLVVFWETG
jgi:hypothetical protein